MELTREVIFAVSIRAAQAPTPELEAYVKGNAQRAADQLRNPELCSITVRAFEAEIILRELREEYRNGLTNSKM